MLAPLTVKVTAPPLQMGALPLMVSVGKAFTVTVTTAALVLVQPAVLVPETE